MTLKQKIGLFFVFVISFGFITTYYSEVVISPNEYMFNLEGDAIKNYYSVFNHVKNDDGLMHSQNVNYPNGELILYMDGQFSVSNGIKIVALVFPSVADYSIGIMNILMLFSMALSAVFVYLILLQYKVDEVIAIIGSLSLVFMQPQIFRMLGHFALAYAFVVPLSWWVFEKFRVQGSFKWLFGLLIINQLFFFIHPYLGLIITLFEVMIVVFSWLLSSNKRIDFWLSVLQIVLFAIPLIIFRVLVSLADFHVDRSNDPYGLFEYQAALDTIFVPILAPFNPVFHQLFGDFTQTWEGWAYIGAVNILGLFLMVVFFVFRNSRVRIAKNPEWKKFAPVLLASWFLLWFSMGVPFELFDNFLVEQLPVVKQFRALGRFAWVFYYVTGIMTILMIQYVEIRKEFRYLWISIFAIAMVVEGYSYHELVKNKLTNSKNIFSSLHAPEGMNELVNHVPNQDFQALLPLPFYMNGSEDVSIEGTSKSVILSQAVSGRKDIAIIGGMMSRTSISETKRTIELLSPVGYPKSVLDKYDSDKPILVVYTGEELSVNQQSILDRSKPIFRNDYGSLHVIFPSQFYECTDDSVWNITSYDSTLVQRNHIWVSDSSGFVYYEDYDSLGAEFTLFGNGSLVLPKWDFRTLKEFDAFTFESNTNYELSLWFYNHDSSRVKEIIGVHSTTPEGVNDGWLAKTNAKNSETVFGNWSLVKMGFRVDKPENTIRILSAADKKGVHVYYDNLMVRESAVKVVQKTVMKGDSVLIINNEIISFCK